ncbi:helix-turn-helix domain-containing protein [Paenibacillus sepulcri]|uniref:Response regulator n=1 Tax=Paenibacillus sepulcri TaxID=359917 RepID=A0ABS7C0P5_9BACL|nr:response regulator [Paenibacillus sepulcri]
MYRLLLVEDEWSTRKWLSKVVDWESFGFHCVDVVEDGLAAWEKLQSDGRIDAIMTDIRMPRMDGMELVSRIRDAGFDTEVVISSGYGEFEYAQQAIKLGVAVYLLKPITKEQLCLEFESLKVSLDEKHMRRSQLMQADSMKKENERAVIQHCLQQTLLQFYPDSDRECVRLLDLASSSFPCITILAEIDEYARFLLDHPIRDQKLCKFMVMNILNEIAREYHCLFSSALFDNRFIFIIPLSSMGITADEWTLFIGQRFQEALRQYLNVFELSISVGGSAQADNPDALPRSFREAEKALNHKFFKGKSSITGLGELAGWNEECNYPFECEKRLALALKQNEIGAAAAVLEDWFALHKQRGAAEGVIWATGELLVNVTKQLTELKSMNASSEWLSGLPQQFEETETLEDLKTKMSDMIHYVMDEIQMDKTERGPVFKGIEYIQVNMNRDISLQQVANYAGISSSYFSTRFKQEVGENFIDYMVRLRMEKAQGLLERTKLTIIQIGEQIGYNNYRYFTRVFKDQYGMTPSQYRSKVWKL